MVDKEVHEAYEAAINMLDDIHNTLATLRADMEAALVSLEEML